MDEKKACPFCGEEILAVAIKCKHCKSDISAVLSTAESRSHSPEIATVPSINIRRWSWNPISLAISVHRGEKSLALTYWIWIAIPMAVFNAGALTLGYNSIYLSTMSVSLPVFHRVTVYQISINGLVAISLCWIAYFGSGILTIQRKTKTAWSRIAIVVVVLSFLVGAARYIEAMTGRESDTDTANDIAILNAQLPRQIDKITTLQRIDYSENTLTYHYVIDGSAVERMNWDALLSSIHGKDNCDTWKGSFSDGEVKRIDYNYESPAGNVVHTISLNPADCP